MNSRNLAIWAALAVGLTVSPCRADGFLGMFGKKEEKTVPAQEELNRREGEAQELRAKAAAAEARGDAAKAAKLYLESAKEFPLVAGAADASFKAGELYESVGKAQKAFDAYQEFITGFKADKRFQTALDRQFALATACKDGQFSGKLLGLSTGVSRSDTIAMFETIAGNAPRGRMAGKARIAVAELHQKAGDVAKAVASYQKVVDEMPGTPEASDAQFRIGQTYQAKAEQKSKDRTTATDAREAYEDYLLMNPSGSMAKDARGRIDSLSDKEAKETFEIAKFYERTGKPQAAAIYYREVLGYGDADLAEKSRQRLDALGAAGITAPTPPADDAWSVPEESRTKDRDDYAGPPVPDLRPRLPSLRYMENDVLPRGADLPALDGDNPLLEQGAHGSGDKPQPDASAAPSVESPAKQDAPKKP